MIYLPTEMLNKPCYVINNDYIRVYETTNTNQSNVVYDVYINQDYMIKKTTANYSSSTVCDTYNTYTDSVYYRVDFDSILIILVIMSIFCFLIPLKVFVRLFRRFT